MSKIVVLGTPAYGHLIPMLGPVAELVRRGHEVVFYNAAEFETLVVATGARFVAYPPALTTADFTLTLKQGDLLAAYVLLLRATPTLTDFCLVNLRENRPDVVVYDAVAMWGYIAARTLGLRAVSDSPIFVFEFWRHLLGWGEFWGIASRFVPGAPLLAAAWLKLLRFGIGNLPLALPLYPVRGIKNIILTSRELHPKSPLFKDENWVFSGASIDARTRHDRFDFDQLDGRPVILVSMGTVQFLNDRFFRLCMDTFSDYPAQFLLAAGPGSDITRFGVIPDNFIVQQTFPQMPVLERAALFITHGGLGSVHETLWNGVPFVAVPQHFEQLRNARAAAKGGAGIILDGECYGRPILAAELRSAVQLALENPELRTNAARLGETLKSPGGYVRVADVIEEIAINH